MTKPKFELIGMNTDGLGPLGQGFVYMVFSRVCGEGSAEEAEQWIRENHPAGTTANWHLSKAENRQPVACADDPKRTHYMFEC